MVVLSGVFGAVLPGFLHMFWEMRLEAGVDGLGQVAGQRPHLLRVFGHGVFIQLNTEGKKREQRSVTPST